MICRWAIELSLDGRPATVTRVTEPMAEEDARAVAERIGRDLSMWGREVHPGFTTWSLELVPVQ